MMITAYDHPNVRVSLNGEDISANCFAADAEAGRAVVYKLTDEGHRFLSWPSCGHRERVAGCVCETFTNAVQAEIVSGDIVITETT